MIKPSTLKSMVYQVLQDYPQSRNSDQWLTLKVWCNYYPTRIHTNELTNSKYIFLRDVMDLPREDLIGRVRRIIQNIDNKFLPTSLEVAKQRKINEGVWREYIKNNGK